MCMCVSVCGHVYAGKSTHTCSTRETSHELIVLEKKKHFQSLILSFKHQDFEEIRKNTHA